MQHWYPEKIGKRSRKLAGIEQTLGLRLIEKGDSSKGREYLWRSIKQTGGSNRIYAGLLLSYLPLNLRQLIVKQFHQSRAKDYSEIVREVTK